MDIANISSNVTNSSKLPPHHLLSTEVQIMLAVEVSICIAGIIGNGLCMVTLLHSTQRHFGKTAFLVSLSISDILTLTVIMRHRLMKLTSSGFPGPLGWCNIMMWIGVSALHMSSTGVALFTIHRVKCMYYPKVNSNSLRKKNSIKGLVICWAMTLILFSPLIIAYEPSMVCKIVPEWNWFAAVFRPIVQLILANILTDIIIVIGNAAVIFRAIQMAHNIRSMSVAMPQASTSMPETESQEEPYNTVIRTCLGLGFFHVLTTLPSAIFLIGWHHPAQQLTVLSLSVYFLGTVNYAGNFVVYMMVSKNFRNTIGTMFSWW